MRRNRRRRPVDHADIKITTTVNCDERATWDAMELCVLHVHEPLVGDDEAETTHAKTNDHT